MYLLPYFTTCCKVDQTLRHVSQPSPLNRCDETKVLGRVTKMSVSAYEQKVEPPDRKWQYLLFAAEPYETIAFKVSLQNKLLKKITDLW